MIILSLLEALICVVIILLILGIISLAICFVGYIAEEAAERDNGFFHRIFEAIDSI